MTIKHLTVLSFPYAHKGKLKPSYNLDTSYLHKGSTVHHNIMVEEDSALGLPIPAIIAKDNSSVQFATFAEMTTLLLRYGAARAEMSSTFALKRKAVEAATTLEEVALVR